MPMKPALRHVVHTKFILETPVQQLMWCQIFASVFKATRSITLKDDDDDTSRQLRVYDVVHGSFRKPARHFLESQNRLHSLTRDDHICFVGLKKN